MSQHSTERLFRLEDFRPYLYSWVEARGRGEFRRIATALNMHTTLISQIMSGKKCFTEEQAIRLCAHMNLNSLETDYFVKLVQLERAGTQLLKDAFQRHLEALREAAKEVKNKVPGAKPLSKQDRALFYSSWHYATVRLMTSIPRFQSKEAIAAHLGLSLSRTDEILEFLVSRGLCTEHQGRYQRTEKNTHVDARSSLVTRHHQNWRARSLDLVERMTGEDLAFTAPIALASKDAPLVRELLLEAISGISKLVERSEPEEIVYLGIDWLKLS